VTDDVIAAALAAIRSREQAATPGPWAWFGNTDTHSIYLATRLWGRFTVMGFRRWGDGARPMFATGRTWKRPPRSDLDFGPAGRMAPADLMFTAGGEMADADALPVYAVAPDAVSRKDPRVYRADLSGIRNPDAEFIAGAREDVPRLLAAVGRVLSLHYRSRPEAHCEECRPEPHCGKCGGPWPCTDYREIEEAIARAVAGEADVDG